MATQADGQLLELLLTGAPDKAIAVKLGISERTVQRRVGRLMGEFGATNRMQLGRYAADLDEPDAEAEDEAEAEAEAAAAAGCGSAPSRPDHLDLLVLALLYRGAPEQTVAWQMEISRRTVQRRVRRLMETVGASNWTQLGWQATRRGWI